jgi:hypothetical protein
MSCQEVAFANGICRLDIADRTTDPTMPLFRCRIRVIDPDRTTSHDLVLAHGEHVEIHAPTEALAISSALSYLSNHFGSLSEYPHGCQNFEETPPAGDPVVVTFP